MKAMTAQANKPEASYERYSPEYCSIVAEAARAARKANKEAAERAAIRAVHQANIASRKSA